MNGSFYKIFAVLMVMALLMTGCQVEKQPTKIGEIGVGDQPSDEEPFSRPRKLFTKLGISSALTMRFSSYWVGINRQGEILIPPMKERSTWS